MKGNWIIYGNHIAIDVGDRILHPMASDIYPFIDSKEPSVICGVVCNPIKESLPHIRFSKIGLSIHGVLDENPDGGVNFNVYANKRNKYYQVDICETHLIDHCICDNVWHFMSSNVSFIDDFINKLGIEVNGKISFKQYLKAIEQIAFLRISCIKNEVKAEQLTPPINTNEAPPITLKASLYPYQETGYRWLKYMLRESGGCILGDEMGLGKTMQVIATILQLKQSCNPRVIVVAPISLLTNWMRECNKFAPSLCVHVHHGPDRISNYKDFFKYDVVITSYTTVVSDIYMLNMIEWTLAVLDEAQNIKNPDSQRTKACKMIRRSSSLAVSGTPFENHVSDIWSLVDFIMPNLLGSLSDYSETISDNIEGAQLIEPILTPLMLRRLVKDVAQDLPEKIVTTQPLRMSEEECVQYGHYLSSILQECEAESVSLGMLQKLRIYCTHPYAVSEFEETNWRDPYEVSIKYQRFCEIVQEIVDKEEKIIVFTSYKKMFDIFHKDVPSRFGIKLLSINGETPVEERQSIVDHFNSINGSAILILNPRAAGTGLNITGANHVIHYNLEWNPSLEDQSTARAHRRGQHKTVFVYRLFYEDTIEQVVNERILRKRDIASIAIVGNDGISQDRKDIIAALKLTPSIKNNNI